jgi:hypothetical protein
MVNPANGKITIVSASNPVVNYWMGDGGFGDGGNIIGTSWVMMSLSFADTNIAQPAPVLSDKGINIPIAGNIQVVSVTNGVTISGATRSTVTLPPGTTYVMPIGAVAFTLNNVPLGGIAELDIVVPQPALDPSNPHSFVMNTSNGLKLKPGLHWFKFSGNTWNKVPSVPITIDVANSILKVFLRDGGPEDQDGKVNGSILDPGAPGIDTAEGTGTSDSGSWLGVCFIDAVRPSGAPFLPILAIMGLVFAVFGLAALGRRN